MLQFEMDNPEKKRRAIGIALTYDDLEYLKKDKIIVIPSNDPLFKIKEEICIIYGEKHEYLEEMFTKKGFNTFSKEQ